MIKFQALSDKQKKELELRRRYEYDGRIRERIKAVLLKSENWTNKAIKRSEFMKKPSGNI